jgi:hypothetical protein
MEAAVARRPVEAESASSGIRFEILMGVLL